MERLLRFPKNKVKCIFLYGFHYWYWKTEISIRIHWVLCVSSFHKNMDTHDTHDTPIRICYTVFATLFRFCQMIINFPGIYFTKLCVFIEKRKSAGTQLLAKKHRSNCIKKNLFYSMSMCSFAKFVCCLPNTM